MPMLLLAGCATASGAPPEHPGRVTKRNAEQVFEECLRRASGSPGESYRPVRGFGSFLLGFRRQSSRLGEEGPWVDVEFLRMKEERPEVFGMGAGGPWYVSFEGRFRFGQGEFRYGDLEQVLTLSCPDPETASQFADAASFLKDALRGGCGNE